MRRESDIDFAPQAAPVKENRFLWQPGEPAA